MSASVIPLKTPFRIPPTASQICVHKAHLRTLKLRLTDRLTRPFAARSQMQVLSPVEAHNYELPAARCPIRGCLRETNLIASTPFDPLR